MVHSSGGFRLGRSTKLPPGLWNEGWQGSGGGEHGAQHAAHLMNQGAERKRGGMGSHFHTPNSLRTYVTGACTTVREQPWCPSSLSTLLVTVSLLSHCYVCPPRWNCQLTGVLLHPLPSPHRPAKILDTYSLHTAFTRALEIRTQVLTVVQQVLLPSEPCLQHLQ